MPPLIDLIGRRRELERLKELHRRGARLITLWGPGGAGKTRLARHFAGSLAGATSCDLTDARSQTDIVRIVAGALRLELADSELEGGELLGAALARHRGSVLLLDNVEQVARAARVTLQGWLSDPSPCLLVTSREPLGLDEEAVVELGVLPEADAVELLLAAARALGSKEPSAALARRIVNRLDRLPLAIELAAARLPLLSPEALLDRLEKQISVLRDGRARAARQATLDAMVRWSWDLLAAPEQRALCLCALFQGGFSAEAGEALLARHGRSDGLELLDSLRLRSMIWPDASSGRIRFRLYEAVREFSLERLDELGLRTEGELAHAEVMLAAAEPRAARTQALRGPLLDELAGDSENLLAVHHRLLIREPSLAARALLALRPLLLLRGPLALYADLLDATLSRPRVPVELQLRLHIARGELRRLRGQLEAAHADLLRARKLARDRHPDEETEALLLLGAVARTRGRARDGLRYLSQALARTKAADQPAMTAACLGELGTALAAVGRLREACVQHRMALDLHRQEGNRWLEGVQLSHLGVATHRLGAVEEALELHRAALTVHRELGNQRFEAAELSHLAYVHHQRGQLADARRSYGEALAACQAVGDRRLDAIVRSYLGDLETDEGNVLAGRALLRDALGYQEAAGDEPQQAAVWLHLGYSYFCAAELDEAGVALETAAELASPDQVWVIAAAFAHLCALARSRGDERACARAKRSATAALARVENPNQRLAVGRLCGEEAAGVEAAARRSSDLRRALRWTTPAALSRELLYASGAAWFSLGAADRVDLSRRGPMRRILDALLGARLARPGAGLAWHEVFEAGWPGQHIDAEAALQRVYTAVWTLRKLGLEGALQSRDDGYLIDPALPVRQAI